MAAGPIEPNLYEEMKKKLRTKSKKLRSNIPFLLKCSFDLSVDHSEVKGDIFMSNYNSKLFIGVSVDDLIISSQQIQSLNGSASVADSLSET